jgi:hypothetical protein
MTWLLVVRLTLQLGIYTLSILEPEYSEAKDKMIRRYLILNSMVALHYVSSRLRCTILKALAYTIPEMGGLQDTVAAPFWQKLPFCHRKIGNYGGKTVDIKQRML